MTEPVPARVTNEPRKQTAVRLPESTQQQIAALIPRYGKNASQIMITAIDRMYREEHEKPEKKEEGKK